MATSPIDGVILGTLTELHPDCIVIGGRTLFLRDGEAFDCEIGMVLEVIYRERGGRGHVAMWRASRHWNAASSHVRVHPPQQNRWFSESLPT